jgi:hypothetical protein
VAVSSREFQALRSVPVVRLNIGMDGPESALGKQFRQDDMDFVKAALATSH